MQELPFVLKRFAVQLFCFWLVIYGPPLLALNDGSRVARPEGHGLGSVRQLSDPSGASVESLNYSTFGILLDRGRFLPRRNAPKQSYGFAGEPEISVGLAYHRARWMDPRHGRFLSMDPWPADLRHPLTLNRYAYALGNPVNYTDPTGLFAGGVAELTAVNAVRSAVSTIQGGVGSNLILGAESRGALSPGELLRANWVAISLGGAVTVTAAIKWVKLTKNVSRVETAREIAGTIFSNNPGLFSRFNCKNCKNELKSAFQQAGLGGEVLEVRSATSFIYSDRHGVISETGRHFAVKIDDVIFDNLNPGGTSYRDWLEDLGGREIFELGVAQLTRERF